MPSSRSRRPHVARTSIPPALLLLLCIGLLTGRVEAQVGLGQGAANRLDTLAVTPVESPVSVTDAADRAGVGPSLVRVEELFGERLGTSLAGTRKFTMVARSKLDAVLAEQAFAASGFVDTRDPAAAKAMQVAGVRWLAVPRVVDFEDAVRTRRFAGLDREVSRRTIRLAVSVDVLDSTSGVVGETVTVTVEATDTADEDTRARPEGSDPTSRLIDLLATDAAAATSSWIPTRVKFSASTRRTRARSGSPGSRRGSRERRCLRAPSGVTMFFDRCPKVVRSRAWTSTEVRSEAGARRAPPRRGLRARLAGADARACRPTSRHSDLWRWS